MGKPSKRNDQVIARIIEGLSKGTPLTQICDAADMPADRTVRDWMDADPDLSAEIARAREAGFDRIAVEALAILDTEPEMATGADGSSKRDAAYVSWQKARFEGRLKLLAKWDPKRYGEMIKHANSEGGNLDVAAAILAGNQRVGGGEQ